MSAPTFDEVLAEFRRQFPATLTPEQLAERDRKAEAELKKEKGHANDDR